MINAIVENDKVKIGIFNKTKDKLRKLYSKFKEMCPSTNEECDVSNQNARVVDIFNSLANQTFIQHLKSSISCIHSADNKLKGNDASQCFKIMINIHFY